MDVSQLDFGAIRSDDLCETYIKELEQLAVWGRFDCIGHLDLIKRYSANFYKSRVTLMSKHDLLKKVFKIIIPMGRGIEINTSGLRQGPRETMPGLDVLKLYRSLGGEILTIGSDAHCMLDQGRGINDAMELAAEAGFKYITVFDSRKPSFVRITEEPAVHTIEKKLNIA
jgi:histidinol-phosphatase (PHP family)